MRRIFLPLVFLIVILGLAQNAHAATAPDAPTGLSAVAVSPTQVNLFWSAPTNNGDSAITGYKIEYKVGSGSYSNLVANTGTTTTTYSHTGLTTGTQYTYRVSAINSVGTGTASGESSATPSSSSTGSNPGAPTGLSATPVSPTQVNLMWTAPANTGGYPITGYKIEYRIGANSYSTLIENTATTATFYAHSGLTTNQVYVYRVYTLTAFGTSTASNEDTAQPQSSSAPSAPSQPTNLSATPVSPTQINLSWTAPSPGTSPITGYKIEVKSGSSAVFSTLVSNTGTTTTTYSHTGLTTGTQYTYRVSAINSVGTGTASNEASATPSSSSSSSAPSAPTNLSATAVTSNQINLSWSAPASTGGNPITGYKIEYKTGSSAYATLVSNTGTTTTTYSHTGLTTGTQYTYRVSAINSVGTGTASNEASATPGTSSSVSPPSSPVGLSALAASPTQINLSWSAPSNNGGAAVTGYKIDVKKGTGSFETLVANSQSTITSFSHTGLTTGTTYYYRVSAINSAGTGSSSEASATPKDTVAPTLSATAVSPTSISLSWIAPSQTYKQTITGYKIEEKIGTDTFTTLVDNTGSAATSYTVSGIATGTSHTYVVSAYFTLGASPRSNEASATPTTTSAPPASQPTTTPPSVPTGLVATAVSPTQINLSWSAPTNNGGSPITGYKIDVKKGTAQFETLTASTQNSTTKYSHAGLETGSAYAYRVYAISAVGISQPSNEASATPALSSSPPPSQVSLPKQPTLTATLVSPTQINLSWTAPQDSQVTSYKIEYKIGSDKYRTLSSKVTDTDYSHTGLLANTYSYRVYAINSAGTGPASNEVSILTAEQEKPDTPPDTTDDTPDTPGTGAEPEPEKPALADFVDPDRDPMHYVNRYNNEPEYREWFEKYYPEMTIYEAVGLPDPSKEPAEPEPEKPALADFVDPDRDPMHYVNRYNNEPEYREWFERNYPQMTIYEAVGLPNPEDGSEDKQCGPGTHLEGGVCVLDEVKEGGGCLIATAVFGSEMAPQVQMLREIRDNVLYDTASGTAFMSGFNKFYYSFSPAVADLERQSPAFKGAVRVMLAPMLSTLSILNHAEIGSEQQMMGYGIGLILLNAGIYLGAPVLTVVLARSVLQRRPGHFRT